MLMSQGELPDFPPNEVNFILNQEHIVLKQTPWYAKSYRWLFTFYLILKRLFPDVARGVKVPEDMQIMLGVNAKI